MKRVRQPSSDIPLGAAPSVPSTFDENRGKGVAIRTEDLLNPAFWDDLLPGDGVPSAKAPHDDWTSTRRQLEGQGYFTARQTFAPEETAKVAIAMRRLTERGLHEAWVFACVQPWQILRSDALRGCLSALLGDDYVQLPDHWATYLGRTGQAGFAPHPDAAEFPAVREDGRVNAVTIWIALTEATPDNGCIYLIPGSSNAEPFYPFTGPSRQHDLPALLHRVEAVSMRAGSFAGWNHQTIHWGGRYKDSAAGPRASLSGEFIRADALALGHPHLKAPAPHFPAPEPLPIPVGIPDLRARLKLTATQIVRYFGQTSKNPFSLDLAQAVLLALA